MLATSFLSCGIIKAGNLPLRLLFPKAVQPSWLEGAVGVEIPTWISAPYGDLNPNLLMDSPTR